MPTLEVIVVRTRPRRVGPAIAEWFTAQAADHGAFTIEEVDLAQVDLPFLDEPELASTGRYTHDHTRRWSATVAAADAFVFVLPEYNYGVPAPFKNALDFLYQEWAHKPVGFVSYGYSSAGRSSVEMARQLATSLRMVPVGTTVSIPLRDWTENGDALRADTALVITADTMLTELAQLAEALRTLREPAAAGAGGGR